MAGQTLHDVRAEAFNYVWDNAIPPALEVDSGAEVELHVRDAGDEQIGRDSGAEAVTALDFSHVNPVSGPVFVKDAKPGDVLAVEILELRPGDWGWTAIIPGFGLLADEFLERFPGLLDGGLITRHFSAELLATPAARATRVAPDLHLLPAHM